MAATDASGGIFRRLDQLNEFEREPVTETKLQSGMYFAGTFAGEHVAATEFVIGALFVTWGARTYDVVVGLLLGNLLAVLSWTLVCAPIAVKTRLTLYWHLRKIAGPTVMVVYNVLNAVLYCILAGCMITVAASAVRIPFGIEPQTGWLPTDPLFYPVVVVVGALVVALAILGFRRLAQFASVCSPWMLVMFVAGALVLLPKIGHVHNFSSFWWVADRQIWTGPGTSQAGGLGFWHVAAFAWICNLAMHLGLSDMALFRYARRSAYGLYSAFGMYLGHYLAWICAGIMGAAAAKMLATPLEKLDSGEVAVQALGLTGAMAVVIAGWTTSNPTLYRAGLALQVVTPGWPRWLVTLIAGVITTAIACFPFVFRHLLDFVAIYGILLVPVGAIVVMEHWIFPRIGFTQYWSARKRQLLNRPALVSWGVAVLFAAVCWGVKVISGLMVEGAPWERVPETIHRYWTFFPERLQGPIEIIHEYFLVIPVWILTAVVYTLLAARAGARQWLPELEEEKAQSAAPAPLVAPPSQRVRSASARRIGYYAFAVAVACLLATLAFSFCMFIGFLSSETILFKAPTFGVIKGPTFDIKFNDYLVGATLVYFISGVIWMILREDRQPRPTL